MHKGVKLALAAISAICLSSVVLAATDPTTFVGPSIQGTFTGWMSPIGAYSFLVEGGPKEFRASGTLAWQFQDVERIKFTAEYLTDRINYRFYPSNLNRWRSQGAVAIDYQYQVDRRFNPIFDFTLYGSHAPSTNIDEEFIYPFRRLAGATGALGGSAGLYVDLWCGGKLGFFGNYDNVRYDNEWRHPTSSASGFGGSATITQVLTDNIAAGFSAQVRAPFSNYQASINYGLGYHGRWNIGIFGNYTNGKKHLPNSANAGITLNYYADRIWMAPVMDLKDEGRAAVVTDVDLEYINWVSDPAVYMPQVLNVSDQPPL